MEEHAVSFFRAEAVCCIHLQVHTEFQRRRPTLTPSPSGEPLIPHYNAYLRHVLPIEGRPDSWEAQNCRQPETRVRQHHECEPCASLPYSQDPISGPYPEPDESSPHPQPNSSKSHFNIILASVPRSPNYIFPTSFPSKILYAFHVSPTPATCLAKLISLDVMTIIIYGEHC